MASPSHTYVLRRRDEIRVGDTVLSSHGYHILVTEVRDYAARSRSEDRIIGLIGHVHGNPERELVSERFPISSLIALAVPES